MPLKHGAHHGISFVLGIALSVLLSEIFRSLLPGISRFFRNIAKFIVEKFNLSCGEEIISVLLIAFIVIIIYGMIFGFFEKRRA
jgi:hypothetical protein